MLRNQLVDIAASIGTTHTGNAVAVDKAVMGFAMSAKVSAGSSPIGSLKMQASIEANPTSTDWADIADTATAVTADGITIWNFDVSHFLWVRVVYTRTSGSATLNTRLNENA